MYKVYIRAHHSILAQLRFGILPIKTETGRYTQIPREFRLCILCDFCLNVVFIMTLDWPIYRDWRNAAKNLLHCFIKISLNSS